MRLLVIAVRRLGLHWLRRLLLLLLSHDLIRSRCRNLLSL